MSRFTFRPLATLAVVLLAAAASPLSAAVVYDFTGACTDCFGGMGNATATLVLADTYVPGNTILMSDFISFTYTGTDLLPGYTIDSTDISFLAAGSFMPATSGFADFFIAGQPCPTCQGIQFQSLASDGTWSTGPNGGPSTDMGTVGTYQLATPEPSAVILVGGGLGGLALLRRRRTPVSQQ